jgi:hypothetical protein
MELSTTVKGCTPKWERQTVVLVRHPDHTVGPAQRTSLKPICGVNPVLYSFYPFSCAVVRSQRMTYCWRSQKLNLCGWIHHLLKRRHARLSRVFSPQPTHQLKEIDRHGDDPMAQMCFVQANVARPPQSYGARSLRVRSRSPGSMTIALLISLGQV